MNLRRRGHGSRETAIVLIGLLCVAAHPSGVKMISLIEKARALQKKGKYQKAEKSYEKILKEGEKKLSRDQFEEIRNDYQTVKIRRLLSKAKNMKSLDYTVQPGDTLYHLAQKYGATTELIQWMNELKGDLLYPGMKLKIIQGVFAVRIDKSENQLKLFLNNHLIKQYSVATGAENKTPAGNFKIINKVEHPIWYKTGAVVPAGSPDNSLGTRWLGLDLAGYGIHGTIEPESIGKQVSLGCVRMLNQDVEELYAFLPLDTKVTITD